MKKLFIFVLIAIVLIAGLCVFLSQPKQIIKDTETYKISRVMLITDGEGRDIIEQEVTSQMDLEQLAAVISKYECSRVPTLFAPYSLASIDFEINGVVDGSPLHILLGDLNIAYVSSDKGGYKIKNAQKLIAEISALLD